MADDRIVDVGDSVVEVSVIIKDNLDAVQQRAEKTKQVLSDLSTSASQSPVAGNTDLPLLPLGATAQHVTFMESALQGAVDLVSNLNTQMSGLSNGLARAINKPISMLSTATAQLSAAIGEYRSVLGSGDTSSFTRMFNNAVLAAERVKTLTENITSAMNLGQVHNGKTNPIIGHMLQNNDFLRTLRASVDDYFQNTSALRKGGVTRNAATEDVARSKAFRSVITGVLSQRGFTASDFSDADYRDAARFLMSINAGGQYVRTLRGNPAPIIKTARPINNVEALPEAFREIYKAKTRGVNPNRQWGTTGVFDAQKRRMVGTSRIKYADDAVYEALISLGSKGQNSMLFDLAQRAGLLSVDVTQTGGKQKRNDMLMRWQSRATTNQFDVLGGLATLALSKVREGQPLYPRNPEDNESSTKTIRELNEIIQVLQRQKGINPSAFTENDLLMDSRRFYEQHMDTLFSPKKRVVDPFGTIRNPALARPMKIRNPYTYVIPQVQMNQSGNLVYQNPALAARPKEPRVRGYGQTFPTDAFIEISESPFTYLVGLGREQNNSFAQGKNGFLVIKMNTLAGDKSSGILGLRPVDEDGYPVVKGDDLTEREIMAARLADQGAKYGAPGAQRTYSHVWNGAQGNGMFFVDTEQKKAIEQHFRERGLPSPFELFNSRGMIDYGDMEKTNKQFSNLRKGATPGIRLSEITGITYGDQDRPYRTLDFSLIDKVFSKRSGTPIDKAAIIDGVAYVDPSVAPTSFQGRAFMGAAKFMGQRMSVADLIGLSGAITDKDIAGPNQLITPGANGQKFGLWLPSMAMANLEEKEAMRIVEDLIEGKYSAEQAREMREKYFTDVMQRGGVIFTDSTLKNFDQFRMLPLDLFTQMFGKNAVGAGATFQSGGKTMVPLTARQIEQYLAIAGQETGGLWVHETNDMFNSQNKDSMPITIAESIGIPPSLIRRSNQIYAERLQRFEDPTWVAKHLREIYPDKPEQWYDSEDAQRRIATEMQQIIHARDNEHRIAIDTENGMRAEMLLAQLFPGAGYDRALGMMGLSPQKGAKTAPLFPALVEQYIDDEMKDAIMMDVDGKRVVDPTKIMYSRGFGGRLNEVLRGRTLVGGRTPAAPGTFQNLVNLAFNSNGTPNKAFQSAFSAIQMTDRDAAVLSPQAIQRMNTGDFDGDTIWLYALDYLEGEISKEVKDHGHREALDRFNASMDKARDRILRQKIEEDKQKRPVNPNATAGEFAVRNIRQTQDSQLVMGLTTAGMRAILNDGDLTDEDTLSLLYQFVEAYDQGTQQVMNMGEQVKMTKKMQSALMMGRTFNRLMQQIGQEDATGQRVIDNIFKYRPTAIAEHIDETSPNATYLESLALRAADRYHFGTDFGLREQLLRHVDNRYKPGTAFHRAAEGYANYLADTETGYRFWQKEDFLQQSSQWLDELRSMPLDEETKEFIAAIEARRTDVETGRAITSDVLNQYKGKGGFLGDISDFLLGRQATDSEKILNAQRSSVVQERRNRAFEIIRQQMESSVLTDEDLARIGAIQDTSHPETFQTSYQVTSVEPWMQPSERSAYLIDALRRAQKKDLYAPALGYNPDFYSGALQFGNLEEIAKKEREELLDVPQKRRAPTADIILGDFMHQGFEQFWKNNINEINNGKYTYNPGEYTDWLRRELFTGGFTDKFGNFGKQGGYYTWEQLFDMVGISIDDIDAAFANPDKMRYGSLGHLPYETQSKIKQMFGIGMAENPGDIAIGAPERLIQDLIGGPRDKKGRLRNRIEGFEESVVEMDANGNFSIRGIKPHLLDVTIDPETGATAGVRPLADLVVGNYDEEGNFVDYTLLDYKSSPRGAHEAMLQQAVYAGMMTEIGKRTRKKANELFVQRKGEIDAGVKQGMSRADAEKALLDSIVASLGDDASYMRYVTPEGRQTIRHLESFSLDGSGRWKMDFNPDEADQYFGHAMQLHLKAAQQKYRALVDTGYMSGKQLLKNEGIMDIILDPHKADREGRERGLQERAMAEAERISSLDPNSREAIMAKRVNDFMLQRFPQDQQAIQESLSEIYKYKRQFGLVDDSPSINRFSRIKSMLGGTMSEELLTAMYSEYAGSPEIQRVIASARDDRMRAMSELDVIMTHAADRAPEEALRDVRKMIYGEQESSGVQTYEAMRRRFAMARGDIEALKQKEGNMYNGKWATGEYALFSDEELERQRLRSLGQGENGEMLALTAEQKEKEKQDYERMKMYNAEMLAKRAGVEADKKTYEDKMAELEAAEKHMPGLITEAFNRESQQTSDQLIQLIGESGDGMERIKSAFTRREQNLVEFIEKENQRIMQIQKALDDRNTDGTFRIDNKDVRAAMQDAITKHQLNVQRAQAYQQGSISGDERNLAMYLRKMNATAAEEELERFAQGTEMTDQERRQAYRRQYLQRVQNFVNRDDITQAQRERALQDRYAQANLFADRQMAEYRMTQAATMAQLDHNVSRASLANMNARYRNMIGGSSGRMALTTFGRTFGMERSRSAQAYIASTNAWEQRQETTDRINQINRKLSRNIPQTQRDKLERELLALQEAQDRAKYEEMYNRQRAFGVVGGLLFGGRYDEARSQYNKAKSDGDISGMRAAEQEMNRYASAATMVNSVLGTMGQTFLRVGAYFGRRLFQNAIREATQFVKVYDQTMRQIQAITMKSDSEMVDIRSKTVDQAIQWRTSASNVAQIKSDLYRQGLSDEEVDRRAESIVKFSTVTGAKVTQATKALTTAIQSGLVSSVEEAMDALTALGDSAATTAEEIFKGMQKSAAAASVAGVSYAELTSMLTVITSKTQLGGAQAGTALQTIFSRMRRVTNAKMVTDESGETTSLNDVEEALNRVGVKMRSDNNTFRSTTEILRDLSKVWNDLNDVQKNNIMYNMAGARQSNMFSALMEGLADEDGKTFEEYLGLAENSEGTTQSKYEIVIEGINAKVQGLKQTFDSLVMVLGDTGVIQKFIDALTTITGGVTSLSKSIGGIPATLIAIATALGAVLAVYSGIAAAKAAMMGDGYTAAARALGVTAAIAAGVGIIGATVIASQNKGTTNNTQESNSDILSNYVNVSQKKIDKVESAIDKAKALEQQGANINESTDALKNLNTALIEIGANIPGIENGFASWSDAIKAAEDELNEFKKDVASTSLFLGREGATKIEEKYKQQKNQLAVTDDGFFKTEGSKIIAPFGLFGKVYEADRVDVPVVRIGTKPDNTAVYSKYNNLSYLKEEYEKNPEDNTIQRILNEMRVKLSEPLLEKGIDVSSLSDRELMDYWGVYNNKGFWNGASRYGVDTDTGFYEMLKQGIKDGQSDKFANWDMVEEIIGLWLQTDEAHKLREQFGFGNTFGEFQSWFKQHGSIENAGTIRRSMITYPSMSQMVSISNQNKESLSGLAEEAVFQMLTSEDAYGKGLNLLFGSEWSEPLVRALASEYIAAGGEIDDDAVYEYAKQLAANTQDILALKYKQLKPENFEYAFKTDEGTPMFGVNSTEKERILEQINIAKQNAEFGGPFTLDGQTISSWEEFEQYITDQYDEAANRNIFRKSGMAVNRSASEIHKDYKLTDKERGYAKQYIEVMKAARKGSVREFENAIGVLPGYETLYKEDAEFRKLYDGLATGVYSFSDLENYAFSKVFGSDEQQYVAQQKSTARNIALSNQYSKELSSGNLENIKAVAQMLNWSEEDVRLNARGAAQELSNIATNQQNAMLSSANAILASEFGYASQEALIQEATRDAQTMDFQQFNNKYNKYGLSLAQNAKQFSGNISEKWASELETRANELIRLNPALSYDKERGFSYKGININDRYDMLNYGKSYTPQEINALGASLLSSKLQWNDITSLRDQSGEYVYSREDLENIKQSNPDLYTYLNLTEKQRGTPYGQNLERKIKTQFEVQGISELEEAGKILSGTADTVSKLKAGGVISLEVELDIHNKAYASGQNLAKLYGGNRQQQDEAAMAILGMSAEEFYSDRTGNVAEAQRYAREHSKYDANTWLQDYNNASSPEQKQRIIEAARKAGYKAVYNGSWVYNYESRKPMRSLSSFELMTDEELAALGIDTVNPYDTMNKQYTNAEKAELMMKALNNPNDMQPEEWNAITGIDSKFDEYIRAQREYKTTGNGVAGYRAQSLLPDARRAASLAFLQGQEEEGIIENTSQYYQGFTSKQRSEREQASRDFTSAVENLYNASIAFDRIKNADESTWYSEQNQQDIATIGQYLGWSETEVKNFQDYEKAQKEMEKTQGDMTEKSKQFTSQMLNLANAFGVETNGITDLNGLIESLKNSSDDAAKGLGGLIEYLAELFGLTMNIPEGTTSVDENTDFQLSGIIAKGYENTRLKKEDQKTINKIYDEAERMTGGFSVPMLQKSMGKTEQEWNDLLERNPELLNILGAYSAKDITRDDALNRLYELTSAGSVDYNSPFMRGYGTYAGLLGNGTLDANGLVSAVSNEVTGDEFKQWVESFGSGKELIQEALSGSIKPEQLRAFNAEVEASKIRNLNMYGEAQEEVASYVESLGKSTKSATQTIRSFNQQISKIGTNTKYRNAWRSGSRDSKTLAAVQEMTGFSVEDLKSGKFNKQVEEALERSEQEDKAIWDAYGTSVFTDMNESLNKAFANNELVIDGLNVTAETGEITLNGYDEIESKLGQYLTEEDRKLIELAKKAGLKIQAKLTTGSNGVKIEWVTTDLGKGGSGSGGGGGGGKSAAQKLLEELKHEDSEVDHRLKMLQYEETRYENAGEITNVNRLIVQENELREELNKHYEENIEKLKEQMATTKKNTDDWYSLRDAILDYEEKIKESNNAIEENTRKIEENWQRIRKLRIDLEQTVDQEIKNRIQRQRDMLAGTVDMENIILDSIKSRYEEEWKLIQKDIEKKKSALEEEKNIIEERLNKRKEAEDEAQKYEELAELRRQYAMISMDSTRTKDATEIRKKITDMEKELAYASAEDEAKARQESLDEQISAYDKYVSNGEEDLQVLLDNANNFADEMNQVIGMKDTELYDWLKANVSEYAKSVNEAQKQILLSWNDTYNQMKGIVETYWDSWKDIDGNEYEGIYSILESREKYLDFMQQSQDYINASYTDQASMMYEWGKAYDDWVNALKTGAFWEHFDDWMEALGLSSTSGSGGNQKKEKPDAILTKDALTGNDVHNEVVRINSDMLITEVGTGQVVGSVQTKSGVSSLMEAIMESMKNIPHNARGGLVDYTGPTWVDGTPSRPEAFLSAADTELMRNMLDAASYLAFRPTISNIDGNAFGKGGISMGDINITITEASFKEDADYEKVAERVGDAFVRQLNKQGLNMANYSFG